MVRAVSNPNRVGGFGCSKDLYLNVRSCFEEDQKVEKSTKRTDDLERASDNALLLSEMVSQFDPTLSTAQDVDIMRVSAVISHS